MAKPNDLLDRTFNFGVDSLKLLRNLPQSFEYKMISYQLAKSSTSVGANYEEAQAGASKADFKNKVKISLKEARESNYWLRVLKAFDSAGNIEINRLLAESIEIKNILGAIVKNTNLD